MKRNQRFPNKTLFTFILFHKRCLDLVRGLVDKHGAVINNLKLFRVKLPTSYAHNIVTSGSCSKNFNLLCERFYLISNNMWLMDDAKD